MPLAVAVSGLEDLLRKDIAVLAVLLAVVAAVPARAAEDAFAATTNPVDSGAVAGPPEAAEHFASEAMARLRRAEDAPTADVEMAAYREALEFARRAVAADERNADAHFAMFASEGSIMLRTGASVNPINLMKVNRELDRALELNPRHADALAAKGGLYRQLPWVLGGDLSKAEDCLTRAVALDPNAVTARIELAATYRDMGQPERGLPLVERALQIAEGQGRRRKTAEAQHLLEELRAKQ